MYNYLLFKIINYTIELHNTLKFKIIVPYENYHTKILRLCTFLIAYILYCFLLLWSNVFSRQKSNNRTLCILQNHETLDAFTGDSLKNNSSDEKDDKPSYEVISISMENLDQVSRLILINCNLSFKIEACLHRFEIFLLSYFYYDPSSVIADIAIRQLFTNLTQLSSLQH